MNNLYKIALLSHASVFATDLPEIGCYFYELPSKINKVQAQLEIKSETTMEFSVAFDAPKLNLPANTIVCRDEPFRFVTETSEMIVGEGSLSTCLQTLKDYTRGVVKTPLRIKWIPEEKILSTTIVIPLRIPKAAHCVQFATPTSANNSTQEIVTSTTPLVTSADSPRIDPSTKSNTTKDAAILSTTAVLMFLGVVVSSSGI